MEARLPSSWKEANISPIPKEKPTLDVNSHLSPISLTLILSKVAEKFVVQSFVKPAVIKKVDSRQFGAIPGSNTTQALISMLYSWNKATDGSGATVRAVLFDFKKAYESYTNRPRFRSLAQGIVISPTVSSVVRYHFLTPDSSQVMPTTASHTRTVSGYYRCTRSVSGYVYQRT